MEILILKTDINSKDEFIIVKNSLNQLYSLNECTIDLEDRDRVLRIIGDRLNLYDITSQVKTLGFFCEELID